MTHLRCPDRKWSRGPSGKAQAYGRHDNRHWKASELQESEEHGNSGEGQC